VKHYFTLVLSVFSLSCFCQPKPINVKAVKRYFTNQNDYGERQLFTNNDDSIYYKSDTISLYDYYAPRCKKFIMWSFDKPNTFHFFEGQHFENGVSEIRVGRDNRYKLKFKKKNSQLYIELWHNKKSILIFQVVAMGYNESEKRNKMILVKQK